MLRFGTMPACLAVMLMSTSMASPAEARTPKPPAKPAEFDPSSCPQYAEMKKRYAGDASSIIVTGAMRKGAAPPVMMAPPPPPPSPSRPAPIPPPPPPPIPSPLPISAPRPAKQMQAEMAVPDQAPSASAASKAQAEQGRYMRIAVPPVIVPPPANTERYDGKAVAAVKLAAADPVSTFSVDVDTGAYANARRFVNEGIMPPKSAVRTEELVNYFRYDLPAPDSREQPFSVSADMAQTPWNANSRLIRIGLRGYDIPHSSRPPANLVFLLDVSGSMNASNKLPLLKHAMTQLAGNLSEQDKVSIVVYAGAAGLALPPTNDRKEILCAVNWLEAGGSTAGGAGIKLAYQVAEDNFIKNGVNRVILATDGDFNVGISNRDQLVEMIENKRDSGITLTTLGFGTGNYNEALIEQLADHGNGNYAYIDNQREARKVLSDEMQSTLFTIAKDVKIQVEFNPETVSEYRLIGYENRALRDEDFDNDAVDAGDIGAGHQVTALYEVVPAGGKGWLPKRRYGKVQASKGKGSKANEAAYVKLRYKMPGGDTSKLIDLIVPAAKLSNAKAPQGDFAFASAVAAYGQKLRDDPLLSTFDYGDIRALAGPQNDELRGEFIELVEKADKMSAHGAS